MNFNTENIVASFRPNLATASAVAGFTSLLEKLQADPDIGDLRWAAYMLATVRWECENAWQPIEEQGRGEGKPYGAPVTVSDANGVNYTNVYYGRGYVQLTWKADYARMSQALGLGGLLVLHPEHALEPGTAYRIMSLGMRKGMFTGVGLERFINEKECSYVNARKVINGLDQAQRIAAFAAEFEKMLKDNSVQAAAVGS